MDELNERLKQNGNLNKYERHAKAKCEAVIKHDAEISAKERELKKYSREEILERYHGKDDMVNNHYPLSWLRHDLAVKLVTGIGNS